MSDNMQSSDTPRQSQLYLQPALLPRNIIGDCFSPTIAANATYFYDMSSIMARCKKPEKEKEELAMLLKDYKNRLQNAEQDILEKDDMLSA